MKKTYTGREGGISSSLIRKPIARMGWLFVLPTLAAFTIGFIWPFLQGLYLSFTEFRLISDSKWTGFSNYIKAFSDASFLNAFRNTLLFAIVTLLVINLIAFFIAYVLTGKIKGANLFRTVFFMPNLIGGIVLGYIWSVIFDYILSFYGTSILLNSTLGFSGLVILTCWQQIGYMMIIYIAGFQAVPEDMIEAAKIDGAKPSQILRKITIPNMMPSITICTFLTLTNSFKLYDQNLALTAGRPFELMADGSTVKTTEMLALNIVNSFSSNVTNRGVGQAKAVVFCILVVAIGLVQLYFTKRKEVQR